MLQNSSGILLRFSSILAASHLFSSSFFLLLSGVYTAKQGSSLNHHTLLHPSAASHCSPLEGGGVAEMLMRAVVIAVTACKGLYIETCEIC